MAIGNTHFYPSVIENTIYDILDSDPEFIQSTEEYTPEAMEKVYEYLNTLTCEWSVIDDVYPNEEGGSVSICWVEVGHLHHIVINYHK